jgi:RibD C-terminal domain
VVLDAPAAKKRHGRTSLSAFGPLAGSGVPATRCRSGGSSKLLQVLLRHELVDRFGLMKFPLVLGYGRPLFNDGPWQRCCPADLTVADLGIVVGTSNPPDRSTTARCSRLAVAPLGGHVAMTAIGNC